MSTRLQLASYNAEEGSFDPLKVPLAGDGVAPARILHVAQSLFHDHAPAQQLGLRSVWIDRRHDQAGTGATPPSEARPDATYPSMAAFAAAATAGA